MNRLLFYFVLLVSGHGFTQYSSLSISLRVYDSSSDTFNFLVSVNGQAIIHETYDTHDFRQPQPTSVRIFRDSLQPATNGLAELRTHDGKLLISEPFVLHADSLTSLNLVYSVSDYVGPRVPGERQAHASLEFFAGIWSADSSRMAPGSWTTGMSFGGWEVLNKHIGFIWDMGVGYKYGKLNDDTTFAQIIVPGKVSEYYSYFDVHDRIRLRFSTGNQHLLKKSGLLFDLGIGYHFPLYFRHVVKYDSQNKIARQGIHRYTDFRAFAGIGFWGATAFLEYRIFNYIRGDLPQMPPFTIGVRITGDAFGSGDY